ncbi:MAG: MFS transporter [Pseudomonadota bacterium]
MTETPTAWRGWLIVGLGFLALGLTFSARAMLGLAMPMWEAEFGWSRSLISTGASVALLFMAVMAPITGWLVDRHGARPLLTGGLALTGAAMLGTTAIETAWQFMLVYGVLGAAGFGLVSMNAVATASARAFPSKVGLASGISSSGSTGGQLVFVPIAAAVIAAAGWRAGYAAAGVLCLALAPVVWWLLSERRAAVDGKATPKAKPASRGILSDATEILRHGPFLVLFLSFVICGATTAGVIETHLMPYAAVCGFSEVSSATAYGTLSFFNLLGMIAAGWLSDRVHRGRLLTVIYLMRATAFVLLIYVGNDFALLMAFAVLFGIFDYSTVPVTAGLVASHLGLHRMGFAMGMLVAGHQVGAAAGAFAGGVFYDMFAEYQIVWVVSVALAIAAALLTLTLSEPRERAAPA